MSAKKPYRKVVVTARRDVDLIDKKPFRKQIKAVPRAAFDAEYIGMGVEPESELKAPTKPAAKRKKKTPSQPVSQTVKAAPWADAREEIAVRLTYKMSQVTHAKMNWIKDNVLRMGSMQKIIDAFVLDGIEKLLKEHYKDTE